MMSFSEQLKESLQEAVEIQTGLKQPARMTQYDVADVKQIRASLQVSQQEFAQALGTSLDTIKSWEGNRRNPTGLAAKVLAAIQRDPALYRAIASI